MLSSSSVRPNQSSQGNAQHTPSGPVTSTLSKYQSLPSSVCVWHTYKGDPTNLSGPASVLCMLGLQHVGVPEQ